MRRDEIKIPKQNKKPHAYIKILHDLNNGVDVSKTCTVSRLEDLNFQNENNSNFAVNMWLLIFIGCSTYMFCFA